MQILALFFVVISFFAQASEEGDDSPKLDYSPKQKEYVADFNREFVHALDENDPFVAWSQWEKLQRLVPGYRLDATDEEHFAKRIEGFLDHQARIEPGENGADLNFDELSDYIKILQGIRPGYKMRGALILECRRWMLHVVTDTRPVERPQTRVNFEQLKDTFDEIMEPVIIPVSMRSKASVRLFQVSIALVAAMACACGYMVYQRSTGKYRAIQ